MVTAVIDSGGANLGSVLYALERLGASVELTRDVDRIRVAERVILPGVGAAGPAMRVLREARLVETIRALKQPVLGICLGLQLLFEFSEEDDTECLGIIPGRVTRLDAPRLPHMGWNRLEAVRSDLLLAGVGASEWFYFVHSFAVSSIGAESPSYRDIVAVGCHAEKFAAVVRRNNFTACQFHPERSAAAGARLLENFLRCE